MNESKVESFAELLDPVEKKYECTICDASFGSQREAVVHVKEDHC